MIDHLMTKKGLQIAKKTPDPGNQPNLVTFIASKSALEILRAV